MKKIIKFSFIAISLLLVSCKMTNKEQQFEKNEVIISAPNYIRKSALDFARLYSSRNTAYELGAQDNLRSVETPPTKLEDNEVPIKLDCSGFVVMCYKHALVDTKYSLLANDMSVATMYQQYSEPTNNPLPGDLVFMGNNSIDHIGIFVKKENKRIYFIDCTQKPAENGAPAVNGVSERSYPIDMDDPKIKAFGTMNIKYYK